MAFRSTNTSERLSSAYERSKDVLGTVSSETKSIYEGMRRWLPAHYDVVAAAAGFGLVGYLAGRRRRPKPSTELARRAEVAAGTLPGALSELDLAPFFKFLKIWMLYRVATKA